MDYIYNTERNLRTTFDRVHYTPVFTPRNESYYFAIVDCDDRCTGDWNMKKQYCGLVRRINEEDEIINVMEYGYSSNSIQIFLAAQDAKK